MNAVAWNGQIVTPSHYPVVCLLSTTVPPSRQSLAAPHAGCNRPVDRLESAVLMLVSANSPDHPQLILRKRLLPRPL